MFPILLAFIFVISLFKNFINCLSKCLKRLQYLFGDELLMVSFHGDELFSRRVCRGQLSLFVKAEPTYVVT